MDISAAAAAEKAAAEKAAAENAPDEEVEALSQQFSDVLSPSKSPLAKKPKKGGGCRFFLTVSKRVH